VLLGSQSKLPTAGPHCPSREYLAVCLFAGKRIEERDLETRWEWSPREFAAQLLSSVEFRFRTCKYTHVLSSAQCWPVRHLLGSTELISQVGWTQWKVMLAAASPAKAPILKRVDLMMI
jgi:hypothetical protein